jgi:pimeloyl-ACP methyl ester carboxylesterase
MKNKYYIKNIIIGMIFILLLFVKNAYSKSQYTDIGNEVKIYSEYYANSKTKFKGTIIFENGSGTDLTEWAQNKKFFQCAKKQGSLFLYDRNGLGKSPPDFNQSAINPITAKFISSKLLVLLQKNKIKPPYIIVTHSYGAMYSGYFALQNPNLISGMIMVDPVPKNFNFSNKIMKNYENNVALAKSYSSRDIYKKIDGSTAEVVYQLLGFEKSKQEVKNLGNINDSIPVVIISSTGMEKDKPLTDDWFEQQKQWLNHNSQSKIFQVNTGHFIQLEAPNAVCHQIINMTK